MNEIEVLAKELFEKEKIFSSSTWESLSEWIRDTWREEAETRLRGEK